MRASSSGAPDQGFSSRSSLPFGDDVVQTQDPLAIIRRAADFAPHLSQRLETALRRAEVEAVAHDGPRYQDDSDGVWTFTNEDILVLCPSCSAPAIVRIIGSPPRRLSPGLPDHKTEQRSLLQELTRRPVTGSVWSGLPMMFGLPEVAARMRDFAEKREWQELAAGIA